MKKQLIIIGFVAILVSVGLSGCNTSSTPKDKLIGKWVSANNEDNTLTFYGNESVYCSYYAYDMIFPRYWWNEYSIAGDKLIIGSDVHEFTFSDDNKKLILNDDEIYNKQ